MRAKPGYLGSSGLWMRRNYLHISSGVSSARLRIVSFVPCDMASERPVVVELLVPKVSDRLVPFVTEMLSPILSEVPRVSLTEPPQDLPPPLDLDRLTPWLVVSF